MYRIHFLKLMCFITDLMLQISMCLPLTLNYLRMKKIISAFLASMLLLGSIGGAAMAENMTPGTYEAEAQGFHGDVKLSVTVDAEKITAIDILEHSETEGIGAAALPKLVEAVLANQTIGVDSVAASEPEDVQMDADVVVVGAGAAGLSAAVPDQRSGKPSRSYSGEGRGAGVCKNLAERLEAAGGTLLTNTPATELVVENGAVVGVKAEGEGKAYTIRAKAVILASGG